MVVARLGPNAPQTRRRAAALARRRWGGLSLAAQPGDGPAAEAPTGLRPVRAPAGDDATDKRTLPTAMQLLRSHYYAQIPKDWSSSRER
jgi:hypothetical protein